MHAKPSMYADQDPTPTAAEAIGRRALCLAVTTGRTGKAAGGRKVVCRGPYAKKEVVH